ncbi:long-chain fatty acid--CoA ligase [soil metagenome]
MKAQRIFDNLYAEGSRSNAPAFGYKFKGAWHTLSFDDYARQSAWLAAALLELGLQPGDKIASITFNRPEWNILDMAVLQIGAVHVSLFPNFNIDDYRYSLEYTDCKAVFTTSKLIHNQLLELGLPQLQQAFTFDAHKGTTSIQQLIEQGKGLDNQEQVKLARSKVKPEDVASIYLTSGTGGRSKGVVVSHMAIMNMVNALKDLYTITADDVALSYAPLCVSSERSLNYYYQNHRICTYYAESMMTIINNMQEVKPTIFLSAPILLEKVRNGILEKSKELTGFKKAMLTWALNQAAKSKENQNPIAQFVADKLAFGKLRGIMGGRVRFIMAGGAAIPEAINQFFWNIGIPVYEGYGASECHIVAVNSDKYGIQFGTVGPAFTDVSIKLATDGEVLCKSPYLFDGYYKMPELTAESFDAEGYFRTGDKGAMVDGKYLRITGRIKDIFKISTGRYIAPDYVEKQINNSVYIEQSLVVGNNKDYVAALIVPSFAQLKQSALSPAQAQLDDEEIVMLPTVRNLIQEELDRINQAFIESERVQRFELLPSAFSIENGDLTPSMKIKRIVVEGKYHKDIAALF